MRTTDPGDPVEDARQAAWLATPPGVPGSGRLRYGAAMYFHQRGRIDDAVLEVFRRLCHLDADDPRSLLPEMALAAVRGGPEAELQGLIEAAESYLSGLRGPGLEEVRAGLAHWAHLPDALPPRLPAAPAWHPVIAQHLPAALTALAPGQPALAAAIAAAAPLLHWHAYEAYSRAEIGADFADGHAFASLIGAEAPLPAEDFEFGLFLIAPHVLYRDHAHPAPELYAPLTGPHGWRFGPDRPLVLRPAHHPVWNRPHAPHLTKVGPVPFLCLFAWTRDVGAPAYVIDARDWPRLEALRLAAEA